MLTKYITLARNRGRNYSIKFVTISVLSLFILATQGLNASAQENAFSVSNEESALLTVENEQSEVAESTSTNLLSVDDATELQRSHLIVTSDEELASNTAVGLGEEKPTPIQGAKEQRKADVFDILTNERVEITSDIEYDFYEELLAPFAKKNGRGEPLENLLSNYGDSYTEDPLLHEDVIRFRRWEWKELYDSLDKKAQENPDHLDTYRLQAEIYLVNKNYKEAFSQLDRILRKDPTDLHALSLSVLAAKVTGEKDQVSSRLSALKYVSQEAHDAVLKVLKYSDATNAKKVNYGSDQLTNMIPDVIAVFGQSPKSDGTPSPALLTRLEKTREMAERYPNIPIVLSGGPVRYPYAEADVMAKWLIENGISEKRLILDEIARDTPGNAIGMVKAFKEIGAKKVLAIGTILHLPRATTVLKVYADAVGYELTIDSAGGGDKPSASKQEGERLYTYVNALRAGYLYTKNDFDKFRKNRFTISFVDETGKGIKEEKVALGEIVLFPKWTKEGYQLKGWRKGESGQLLSYLVAKENITLNPVFEKTSFNTIKQSVPSSKIVRMNPVAVSHTIVPTTNLPSGEKESANRMFSQDLTLQTFSDRMNDDSPLNQTFKDSLTRQELPRTGEKNVSSLLQTGILFASAFGLLVYNKNIKNCEK